MSDFSITLFWIAGAYALLNLYALFGTNRLIFCPQEPGYKHLSDEVRIPVKNGESITAVYLKNPEAHQTILFSHGNAEDLAHVLPFMTSFYEKGYSVLMYDYRGYGTSDGTPSVRRALQDAEAAYQWLVKEQRVPPTSILLQGRSLGGGPSCWLAARHPVSGLILESTFVSTFRVKTVWPLLPWDKFNNLKALRKTSCPVLVMHGTEDEVIPFWHGKKLFRIAPSKKKHLWIQDAHHNDYAYIAGDAYFEAIRTFTQELLDSDNRGN